jgi:vacuolar-type H+-ATPase subunit F/Vma7
MAEKLDTGHKTRMLFLGDDRLADGFRLIGFETLPNPDPVRMDKLFGELQRNRERAFIIVDDHIMRSGSKGLEQVRREGGRIIVVSIPRLDEAPRLASEVADRLAATFGNGRG